MKYTTASGSDLLCGLCPHGCRIPVGEVGLCRVRKNDKGNLSLPYFGKLSAIAMDPVEKKPLYHFFPGSKILSVGFFGCSFRCPFCQNHHISQHTNSQGQTVSPDECVSLALHHDSFAIAYTYSEPLIHFEYLLETAKKAREKGIKNVLITNGFINPGPLKDLLPLIDAANVDLKAFSENFYQDELGGQLKPVLRFIETVFGSIHLEVTTLVIPGKNDSLEEISQIARFLSSLSREIPYHLSAYYPTYKYVIQATEPETIRRLAENVSEYLDYVYPGNVPGASNTVCPSCGALLIERRGYNTHISGLKKDRCASCGHPVYGKFTDLDKQAC